MRFRTKLALFWGCAIMLFAQAQAQETIRFRSLGKQAGLEELSFSGLQNLAFDGQGLLWCGTDAGLFQFDGRTFRPFATKDGAFHPLSRIAITAVLYASDGSLWVGTHERGLYQIAANGSIAHFVQTGFNDGGLADDRIMVLHENKDGIWVGVHEHGMQLFEPTTQRFKGFIPEPNFVLAEDLRHLTNSVQDIVTDGHNADLLWLATANGLVSLHSVTRKMSIYRYPTQTEKPAGIRAIVQANDSTLLLGSWGRGLFSFNTNNLQFEAVPLGSDEFWLNNIKHIHPIGNGSFLLVQPGRGLSEFNLNTGNWHWVSQEIRPSFMLQDELGDMWISTFGQGLKVIHSRYQQFRMILSEVEVIDLKAAYGKNLILSKKPLEIQWRDEQFNLVRSIPLLPSDKLEYPISITPIGTDTALVLFHKGLILVDMRTAKQTDVSSKLKNAFNPDRAGLTCMAATNSNDIWIGSTWNGIIHLTNNMRHVATFGGEQKQSSVSELAYLGWISDLHFDAKGRLWYASQRGHGVYDKRSGSFRNFPFAPSEDGTAIKHISAIGSIGDTILLGSSETGLRWHGSEDAQLHPLLDKLNDVQGIHDMEWDAHGRLFISSAQGLFVVGKDGALSRYGKTFGLQGGETLVCCADGKVRLLQHGKLLQYLEENDDAKTGLQIVFRDFIINGTQRVFYTDSVLASGFKLAYDQNNIGISYSLSGLTGETGLRYFYQLHPNATWLEDASQGQLILGSLAPGKYTLTIRALDADDTEFLSPSIHLQIDPPLWKTWPFRSVLLLILLAVAVLAYRLRIRFLLQKQADREQFRVKLAKLEMEVLRAQMNPHFMFNCLNSIKLLIKRQETDRADLYLTKFSRLLRSVLENSAQETIPLQNDLDALRLYLEMEALRFKDRLEWHIDVDPQIDAASLHIQPLLIQPFAENAIWHGIMPLTDRNGRLSIHIRLLDETTVQVIVEDNGIGRNAEHSSSRTYSSFGSKVTSRRVELGATEAGGSSVRIIDIKDLNNQPSGTRVELTVAIMKARP
jgi:ligand-binding sensor domain-containing protein